MATSTVFLLLVGLLLAAPAVIWVCLMCMEWADGFGSPPGEFAAELWGLPAGISEEMGYPLWTTQLVTCFMLLLPLFGLFLTVTAARDLVRIVRSLDIPGHDKQEP